MAERQVTRLITGAITGEQVSLPKAWEGIPAAVFDGELLLAGLCDGIVD